MTGSQVRILIAAPLIVLISIEIRERPLAWSVPFLERNTPRNHDWSGSVDSGCLSRTVRQSMAFDYSFCRAGPSYTWVMAHLHGGVCFRRELAEGIMAGGEAPSCRGLFSKT